MSSPTFIPIVHIQSSSPMITLKVGTEKVFHQVWIFFTDNDVLVGFWKKKNEDFAVNSNIYNDYFFGELIFFSEQPIPMFIITISLEKYIFRMMKESI